MSKRYPMGHPYGWYHVAFSDELKPGTVVPRQYFGRELVLFRTASGTAKLLDAFCPHLGGHLGYGGTVIGETIACPFHSWRFSGDGVCVDVPYATTTPGVVGRRCIRTWSVTECNRSVYAWFHPRNEPPTFDVVRMPAFTEHNEEWTELVTRQWIVRCHIQDVHENIHDFAHFKSVHRTNLIFDFKFTGHQSRIVMASAASGVSALSKGGFQESRGRATILLNGPGQSWAQHEDFPEFIVLNPVTPVDDDQVVFNIGVSFRKTSESIPEIIRTRIVRNVHTEVDRDIPIFEHKLYRPSPLLCDGDGPVAEFRDWYKQFYID